MNDNMSAIYGWTLDFWRAFLERPKIFRFICRIFMGKYAWSELIGAKMAIEKIDANAFGEYIYYELNDMDYHKENLEYKNW